MDRIVDRRKNTLLKKIKLVNATIALVIAVSMIFTSITVAEDKTISTLNYELFSEGFEDPWVGIPPAPPGWRVIKTTDWTWHQSSNVVYEGQYSARVQRRVTADQNEWLITSEIDLTGIPTELDTIILVFYVHAVRPIAGTQGDLCLYVDADNNNVFPDPNDDLIWGLRTDYEFNNDQWNLKIFRLDDYRDTVIRLAWHYWDIGSGMGHVYLDKVQIFAPQTYPSLDFREMTYGPSFSIQLKNDGLYHVHNITWTASVTGGIMNRINLSATGFIPKLNKEGWSNDVTTISIGQNVRGFGRVDITFTADSEDLQETVVRNAVGFVIINKCHPLLFYDKPWFNIFL